ncbi:uncharacterized protein V1510DRAFT_365627 [Dipodascopsis tothii]|uniref:uncharacterized protein n=1 Tax=Dipodascopsis tothii TaxID=44089 RepID=UPI0034CEC14C
MKFGKYLAKRQLELPEYSNHFINYKVLKKLMKSLGGDPRKQSVSAEEIEAQLQAHKVTFFFRVERELEKVNAFYLQKEAELKLRLAALLEKKKNVRLKLGPLLKTSATFIALQEGFLRFRRDLDKLEQFVELNATGFSKVLKKWDKRSKSHTKELYLSTAVEVQPVFHREDIAELSDLSTTCLLELEAWAEGQEVTFDRRVSEDTTLERTNEELDFDFLRNITHETDSTIDEWIAGLARAPDAGDRITRVFLHAISFRASDRTLRALYATGRVDTAAKDEINERTPLHEAAITGRAIVLDLVLPSQTAVAAHTDIYGRTPLHYACLHGCSGMIARLLDAGAPINGLDQDNFTALLFATTHNQAACAQELIRSGARIDPVSEQDYIPLNLASQKGLYEITEMLLRAHARILPDAEGLYPQHLVAHAGHARLIPLLKAFDADIDQVDGLVGWTALVHASSEGHVETVRALLAADANIYFLDSKNLSPVYYAAWEGHLDCLKVLLHAMGDRDRSVLAGRPEDSDTTVFDSVGAALLKNLRTPKRAAEDRPPFDDSAMESDAEAIPDLALPPPIIPLRRYGHNFLDKKTFVEISFDTGEVSASAGRRGATAGDMPASRASQHAIRIYSQAGIPAAKLTISSKLLDLIPRNLLLPLADDAKTLSFQIDRLDELTIDFEIFPTFGSKLIAKAVALPQIFMVPSGSGQCRLPLFDLRLHTIGEIAFKFHVIKPYQGTPLEITSSAVYWKSTSQVEAAAPAAAEVVSSTWAAAGLAGGGVGVGGLGSSLGLSSSLGASLATSHNTHLSVSQTNHAHSFVTASSLSGEYVRVFVQLTRDLVPVVYNKWAFPVHGLDLPVCELTAEQFQTFGRAGAPRDARARIAGAAGARAVFDALSDSFVTLADVLALLDVATNVDICILYPTDVEKEYLNIVSITADENSFIDAILTVVFDHARAVRQEHAAKARSVVFSSLNPRICTALNWKQPNYPVFFGMRLYDDLRFQSAHDLPVAGKEDRRCVSIKEAATFAASNNLMGLICPSIILNTVPALVESIREYGLVLVAQSYEGLTQDNIALSIDGVQDRKTLEFNETIDM